MLTTLTMMFALTAQPVETVACDLAWLEGRWAAYSDGRWSREVWLPMRQGRMIGIGQSGRADGKGGFEYLRIEQVDGKLVYSASPGGGPATAFAEAMRSCSSLTVENGEHDYPQRIRYERDGDQLTATISNADGSNEISWSYARE